MYMASFFNFEFIFSIPRRWNVFFFFFGLVDGLQCSKAGISKSSEWNIKQRSAQRVILQVVLPDLMLTLYRYVILVSFHLGGGKKTKRSLRRVLWCPLLAPPKKNRSNREGIGTFVVVEINRAPPTCGF